MFEKIKALIEKRKQKRIYELVHKWYELRGYVIKFYEDLQNTRTDLANIPAFQLADMQMHKVIQSEKDLNFYYKKLQKYKLVA